MSEFVSCLLATGNRHRFFQQALRCYLSQDYPHRELIVVDDGEQPVGDHCVKVEGVRYLRLDRKTPTGTKLNLAAEAAAGTILQKLDDDDYYRPEFLATAVGRLLAGDWRRSIAGWDCFLVLLAGEKELHFSGNGWFAGGTLCFSKKLWQGKPFRDIPVDEDHWFLEDHGSRRQLRVYEPEQYILVRHGRNTWRAFGNGQNADEYLRSLPLYPKAISEVVDAEALRFYQALTAPEIPASQTRRSRARQTKSRL
jgi:glycosyltransferase involved in cell wall biosynthesis